MTSTETTSKPRTERIPDAWAGPGAVKQSGGSLPVYRCTTCGREVVWVKSNRTQRRYLVNVRSGYKAQRFYQGNDLHGDCTEKTEAQRKLDAMDHNHRLGQEMQARVAELRAAGASKDEIVAVLDEYNDQWMEV